MPTTFDAIEPRSFMPICLPSGPYEYCHSNITKSTFNRIWTEFLRGLNMTRILGYLGGVHLVVLAAYEGTLPTTFDAIEPRSFMPIWLPSGLYEYCHSNIAKSTFYRRRDNEWSPRRSNNKVIYTVSPTEGEKFYLCVLLSHLRGPTSWESLLTVNGTCFPTFKKGAEQWGFLESDNSIRECLVEASELRMPCALRSLFAIVLIVCEPTDVRCLWDEFHDYMVEDYPSTSIGVGDNSTNMLLRDLNDLLNQHGKQIKDYDLPELTINGDRSR
ncbi:hypothetical protein SESBI_10897 [Sesbania bispinosa]|nr:hypothetical protein SESBI_10897 [Sesbania bispinosa]